MGSEAKIAELGGVAVSELIKSAFSSIASYSQEKIKFAVKRVFADFEPYMLECYKKNRYVRILCQGDDDVDLLGIYVETTFSNKNKNCRDYEVAFSVSEGHNVVITGAGGAGKTFFMRKLWLDLLKAQHRTPIFIELRKFNDLSSPSLGAFIRASISRNLPEEVFEVFCDEGRFIFIFDGFDELPIDRLDDMQSQILGLAERYPKSSVIVSSRPDSRFSGWSSFKVFEAEPFSLKQTKELCGKIPFDSEYRKVFLKGLTPDFYEKYKSFLSNPLLAIMMMMTFRRNMNIPRKMGIFYDEAFATLYQWHDATKAFKRQKNLDIQQFRRSFGVFCLISYLREKFDFSRTELEDFISQSSRIVDIKLSTDQIIDDYERNVNLIRQDGLRYFFIHRSFQEYFAAWAIINVLPHQLGRFAEKITARYSDSVMSMCYDLHRTQVIRGFIDPKLNDVHEEYRLGKRVVEGELWERLNLGVAIYFDQFRPSKSGDHQLRSFGIGLEINQSLREFLRCVFKMKQSDDGPEAEYHFVEPVLRPSFMDRVAKLIQSVLSSDHQAEGGFKVVVRGGSTSGSFRLSVFEYPSGEASTRFGSLEIAVAEEDYLMFNQALKEVSRRISEVLKWCSAEIKVASTSDAAFSELIDYPSSKTV